MTKIEFGIGKKFESFALTNIVFLNMFHLRCKIFRLTRIVRKFWSRLLSCQSKQPVKGYFI